MLTVPIFAHAGIFDRFLKQMVSYQAILVTILTVHILLCIGVKLLNNKLSRLKRGLLKVVEQIRQKRIYTITCSWILCSFVYGVYVCLLAGQIFFWGGLVIEIFLPTFAIFFLRKNGERDIFLVGVQYIVICSHQYLCLSVYPCI